LKGMNYIVYYFIYLFIMSPQTETKTGAGFKAGVKDYRLFLSLLYSFIFKFGYFRF